MTTFTLNQQQARRWARRAQLGFFLVGAAALAVAVPGMRPDPAPAVETIDIKRPSGASSKSASKTYGTSVDPAGVAARFMLIGNRPVPPEEPKVEEPSDPTTEPAVQDEVRYLGALFEPSRRLALIKIGDKQRIVSEGDSITSPADPSARLTIVSVSLDEVVVRDGVGQRTIKKAPREGGAVTHVNGAAAPTGATPGPAGVTAGSPSWLKPGGRPQPKQTPDSPEGK